MARLTSMTNTPETHEPSDPPFHSTAESAGRRGKDDRRGEVNPADNPAPTSPAPDKDAIRKGEEILQRVKPY